MWLYPIVAMGIALLGFVALAIRCLVLVLRPELPTNTKRLTVALGWVCVVFIALIVQGIGQQAVTRGWLDRSAQTWMFTWGTSILATFSLSVGGLALWLLARVFEDTRRDEELVSVMIDSPLVEVSPSELRLTARELEILELMAGGKLSDNDLAAACFISPSTAATHVRNILRKASLSNRRDLVLLYSARREGGSSGR